MSKARVEHRHDRPPPRHELTVDPVFHDGGCLPGLWAYFPNITTKPGQAYLDGVVFDWETIPGGECQVRDAGDQGDIVGEIRRRT